MKIKIILIILTAVLLQSCQQKSATIKSPEDVGQDLLSKTEQTKDTPSRIDPPTTEKSQYKVFTWQVQTINAQNQLVLYGENLQEASILQVGGETLEINTTQDGTRAYCNYPSDPVEGAEMKLTIGNAVISLPERFSLLKPDGITRVSKCRFFKSEDGIPEGIRQRFGSIIQFECKCGDYELTNAPITVFIGESSVPNNQITEEGNLIKGFVEETEDLKPGVPVMIDFGKGLRSLAETTFTIE